MTPDGQKGHNGTCAAAAGGKAGPNRIVGRSDLAPNVVEYRILNPAVAQACHPGQFVIVRGGDKSERIPLTIADFDRREGTVTLVIQAVGASTRELVAFRAGDAFRDLVGPLGHPSEIAKFGKVAMVGGGLGIAPVFPIQRAMKEAGNRVIGIMGARTKELVFWEDRIRSVSDEFHLVTDDGSLGEKGFVTDALRRVIEGGTRPDRVIAIGPPVMMKAVADVTRGPGIKTIVSLNSIMVDGTGMCGGCRIEVGGKTRFTCVDGPEFDAHEVDFDLLISRLSIYRNEEKAAVEHHGRKGK